MTSIGVAQPGQMDQAYKIGPADDLAIHVLDEPEISTTSLKVGNDGSIEFPYIGSVMAAGKTAGQLSADLRQALLSYYRDPRVVVTIASQARQIVTVEGGVEAPGNYPVLGTSSLLQSIALAKGPRRTAKLDEVIVFRMVNGKRMAARFDLRRIRYGYEPDPLILGGDTIVIGFSELKGVFRDFLMAAPLSGSLTVGAFRTY